MGMPMSLFRSRGIMASKGFIRAIVAPGLALLCAAGAQAAEDAQLVGLINNYRSEVQRCGDQASAELPPLTADPRLVQPVGRSGDLQQAMSAAGYPMVNVQAISLSGPRDAAAAMKVLRESFCQVLLDPQFVDIGVNQQDRDWRILLARPLLTARLGDWQGEGQKLLAQLNAARGAPRPRGNQSFAEIG